MTGVAAFVCVTLPSYTYYGSWSSALGVGALMGLVTFGAHFFVLGYRRR